MVFSKAFPVIIECAVGLGEHPVVLDKAVEQTILGAV